MAAKVSGVLAKARSALDKGDDGATLEQLLKAWRTLPAAPIGDAIEAVSKRSPVAIPTAATPTARNKAWEKLARKGDPAAMGMLVETMLEPTANAKTIARAKLLLKHGPDPRLSRRLIDFAETPPFNVTVHRTKGFWTWLWALLPKLGDPRVLDRARGFAKAWTASTTLNAPELPVLAKKLAAIMPALEKVAQPSLPPADAAICAAIVVQANATAPKPDRGEADLLAAIYAAPADDGPRLVYADWLQEHDNPRGEFIALQLATTKTPAQRKREKQLLAAHIAEWLKPLPVPKSTSVFTRGFVSECSIKNPLDGRAHDLIEAIPAWATVEKCNGIPATDHPYAQSLREVTGVVVRNLTILAALKQPLAIERLTVTGLAYFDEFEDADHLAALAKISALPKLQRLAFLTQNLVATECKVTDLDWLWNAPLAKQIEELSLPFRLALYPELLAKVEPYANLRLFQTDDDVGRNPQYHIALELSRDATGRFGILAVNVGDKAYDEYVEPLVQSLGRLPVDQLSELRVTCADPKRVKRLTAACKNQKRL